jgi:Uma2 family endonuclease
MATVSRAEPGLQPAGDRRPGPTRHRLTVADYERMAEAGILGRGERVELIDGEIIDMSPIGAVHAAVVNVLVRHVARHLGGATFASSQNPLRLDDENEPEPDLSILRPRADCYSASHPTPADALLVIEVADTSLAYDLDIKVPLYARHGVPEIWVIEAATGRTHVFRTPIEGGAGYAERRLFEADDPLPFAAIAGAEGEGSGVSLTELLPGQFGPAGSRPDAPGP